MWWWLGVPCEEVCLVLSDCGITMLLLAYVPEQSGVAECENRTVLGLKRLVLSVSGLQKLMWAQACETAVYVLSHTGKTSVTGKFPVELWNDHVMKDLDHLCGKTDINIFPPTRFCTVFWTTVSSYASLMPLNTGVNVRHVWVVFSLFLSYKQVSTWGCACTVTYPQIYKISV